MRVAWPKPDFDCWRRLELVRDPGDGRTMRYALPNVRVPTREDAARLRNLSAALQRCRVTAVTLKGEDLIDTAQVAQQINPRRCPRSLTRRRSGYRPVR